MPNRKLLTSLGAINEAIRPAMHPDSAMTLFSPQTSNAIFLGRTKGEADADFAGAPLRHTSERSLEANARNSASGVFAQSSDFALFSCTMKR
jgi:hypothetical protein